MEGGGGEASPVGGGNMNTIELTELVDSIILKDKEIRENSFKANHTGKLKKQAREMRKKLANMMESDYAFISDHYLARQHHAWGSTVAFYTKESWNKRNEYAKKNDLSWIT